MKTILILSAFCFCCAGIGFAEPATAENPPRLRVYAVRRSFHFWVGSMLGDMARSSDFRDHQVAGVRELGGSTVLNVGISQMPRDREPGRPDEATR